VNTFAQNLRYGVNHSLQILVIEPLFEEYNRTRRLLAEVGRALDRDGVGVAFCDLPGTGESLTTIADVRIADWQQTVIETAHAVQPTVIASLRGGALIDDAASAKGHWRLAPETGARIVRDLERSRLAGAVGDAALYAGRRLSDAFLDDLRSATPAPLDRLRTIRLESDAGDADTKLPGAPLWRRAEPGEDATLAAAIAADLATWTRQCAAS
jgi:hypothetical protein